jgi:mannose-1-phosphate guanylyltransferase / phosphomannomutase
MKAFVMSAGQGTRLRPLTVKIPKPMLTVANTPVLEHTLILLKKYKIKDVVINLHSHADIIKNYFKSGKDFGMNILYSYEEHLLGTAGGLKKVETQFDDTFIVMSGDGLVDIDLQKLIAFHKKKKSIATIVLKKLDSKFDYGIVLRDRNDRVTKFVEKPLWSSIYENSVNTGIYVFEPSIFNFIPKNKFYDFGLNLWPKLIDKNIPIYSYETNGYWCDIGNLNEYRKASQDVLDKQLKFEFKGKQTKKGIWIEDKTKIHSSVKVISPSVIGANTVAQHKVYIDKYTVIGNNCFIDSGAELKNCIILDNVYIGKNVCLTNCIVSFNAKVQNNSCIYNGVIM